VKGRGRLLDELCSTQSGESGGALPLVEASPGRWVANQTKASLVLVPLLSLGRRGLVTEGSGPQARTFSLSLADTAADALGGSLRGGGDERGGNVSDGHEGGRAQRGA